MADVSKLRLDNVTYDIKDDNARKYLVMVNEEPVSATKMVVETRNDQIELALQDDVDKLFQDSYYRGKRIVTYGDSSGTYRNNFVDMLSNTYGLDITNRCIGGTEMVADNIAGSSGQNLITNATDLDSFDICLIIYSINDWQGSGSPSAYKRAYANVCSKFSTSTCKPIFIFPWYCHRLWEFSELGWTIEDVNMQGYDLPAYIDTAIDIVTQYGFNYINLYTASGVNRENYSTCLDNNGGIYVHALEPLAGRVCEIICSGTLNNGKCFNFSSDNYAGFLYNNILISNHSTASDYIFEKNGMFFQANSTSNPIPLYVMYASTIESPPICRFKVRGKLRQNVTRSRLAVAVGSAVQYVALASGVCFDFTVWAIADTFQITLDFPDGAASTSVAELISLEVYCDRPCYSPRFDMTKAAGVTTAAPAKVYIDDGKIKFTPFDLTLSAAKGAQTILLTSPLNLNGFGTAAAILYRGSTRSIVHVFSTDRHIICDTALQSGDRLSFDFPDIKITPHNNQHG